MNTDLATSKRFVLVLGLLTGLVAFAIDISLPAIPPMVRDLATSMSRGHQVVGLFMAGMAVGQLPFGLLSDRLGRMPVLYAGIGIFTIAGVVTSISDHIDLLLAARFVQGIGSSVGLVLARAIVRDVASGSQAARLMSVMVMIFTAAPMLAPMFGSFLVDQWGWRMPFVATTIAGVMIFYGINSSLRETHTPSGEHHILRQLWLSVKEFFSHRQSVFGLVVIMLTLGGIMALISGSAALVIEIYGYPVKYFGFIFALTGVGILIGSMISRRLLMRFDAIHMIGAGVTVVGIAGAQLLYIAWLGEAGFWWIWGNACLYMFGTAFILPNSTALALDPVPRIAGVAASIIGTLQSLSGATSATISGWMYDGTIKNLTTVVGVAGVAVFTTFLCKRLILGSAPLHGHES